ncbi:MAG TPA: substrate-binding domain-containing protein [Blastocatellia bacterium]|nr:substrate-binding domain-containing protein [Blastocatellia bacterium]HMV87379.1 substrate-binding domain-containing protein [Blastocatellia bacterium]HMX24933.1 substrate-binding domain-containing protein [Blastocatellia bacterium]HNG33667.1 substrate-binding domain-containing protein [Blastocatellia bacterium]
MVERLKSIQISARKGSKCLQISLAAILLLALTSCRRSAGEAQDATITLYGFSVVKEPLENEIFPAFEKQWREKTKQQLYLTGSYGGSEVVTNQIVNGAEADIAILSIERHADRLIRPDVARADWHKLPHNGIVNRTPIVIVVRQGNPKRIRDFSDLGKPGVKVIHCDPTSSGAGQWSLLAIYGSEIAKSERRDDTRDEAAATDLLRKIWKNVITTPESARAARTQFERNEGDALVTYEMEALQMRQKKQPIEIVMPQATVLCEHPVVIIDHRLNAQKYALVELFTRSLWDRPAQEAWTRAGFRSVLEELNSKFQPIPLPFKAADFGGWKKVYKDVVEDVWKTKIQSGK